MPNGQQIEASGNLSDWPKNVPGKPTHVAVFGVLHPKKGRKCEILWTGDFPDLEPAMYWGAKKEIHALRKLKWTFASRVIWQHDLTPEQAVKTIYEQMAPQMDRMLSHKGDGPLDLGEGPMKPVDYSKVEGFYVEIEKRDDADGPF